MPSGFELSVPAGGLECQRQVQMAPQATLRRAILTFRMIVNVLAGLVARRIVHVYFAGRFLAAQQFYLGLLLRTTATSVR